MKLHTFDHIAVNTVDINESVRFYTDVLGLTETRRVPNGDNTLVYMKVNDTSAVELFDHEQPISYSEAAPNKSGVGHFCLSVTDIEAWNEHLKKHNVEFTLPLCALSHLGKKVLLFKDPNGVVIELCEDL